MVIAHVQADAWPDLRRRSTLLQADRIGAGELVPPVSRRELLLEERRLFYVAATRARERLVVTAVASPDDEGEQPSRFLEELGVGSSGPSERPQPGGDEGLLLGGLDRGPVHVEELAAMVGLGVSDALALLAELEVKEWVEQRPGLRFERAS